MYLHVIWVPWLLTRFFLLTYAAGYVLVLFEWYRELKRGQHVLDLDFRLPLHFFDNVLIISNFPSQSFNGNHTLDLCLNFAESPS